MKIAIIAPSPVPFVLGGAENLWSSWLHYLNTHTTHQADVIKLPSPERNFWEIIDSYRQFSQLNLDHFDVVIVTKYPAWMVQHRRKIVYMQHKLRGLYDTYPAHLPTELTLADLPAAKCLSEGFVNLLKTEQPTRADLTQLWQYLDDLRVQKDELPDELFALPSPLIRALVHFMDRVALQPNEVSVYAALSQTVATRSDYFPDAARIQVIAHPSGFKPSPVTGYNTIFTTSRHDAPKRLDWLIQAYRQTQVLQPLLIAGEGPQTSHLKALAAGDKRIRFLGRLTPEQLSQAYADALFVPFIPDREDLGLITLEAFASRKAVLTTTDSGGAAEMVQHQQTGLIVEPDISAIADAITQLCAQPAQTQAMGERGLQTMAHISWQVLTDRLLTSNSVQSALTSVLLLNTYSIYPPMGGGQQRLFQLYRHLAQQIPVTHLALVPALGDVGCIEIAPQFVEERIARSLYHQAQERDLADRLSASVGDLSTILYADANPLYEQRLAQLLANQPIVVVSHPYCYPLLQRVYSGAFIYEAHNVEADLKQSILGHSPEHLQLIVDTERACAQQASLVVACSQQDADRLIELYQLAPEKVVVVANGSDTTQTQPASLAQKQQARQALAIEEDRLVTIFMGSYHGPNNQALEHIIAMAEQCPQVLFVVLGSVARHAELTLLRLPDNLRLTGVVSEADKVRYLAASDIALNPMTSGSGTNLKMLDYAAAGLLILSTPFGGRGGVLQEGVDYLAFSIQAMTDYLQQLTSAQIASMSQAQSARNRVVNYADWQVLARHYFQKLG